MAKLTIEGQGTVDVADETRLVQAIADNGTDILYRCGGHAKCTTCRVEFVAGEPDTMTVAERDKLTEQENLGVFRLSCQITCSHDMTVKPLMTLASTGMDDQGPPPAAEITPEPEWVTLGDA